MSAVPHVHCPSCGAGDVRESHSRNLGDAFLALFGMVAYRCRACRNRFHKRPPQDDSEEEFEDQNIEAAKDESDKDSK